jgi:hypothetical protein
VAAFNVSLFSYYSLAPFISRSCVRERVLATAASPWPSGRWPGRCSIVGCSAKPLRKRNIAARLSDTADQQRSGVLPGGYAAVPAADDGITCAYAMAIPLLLGTALGAYGHCRGTAGAIFGLAYYVLIGLGLAAVGWGQSLGGTLIVSASVSCIAGLRYGCCLRDMRAGRPDPPARFSVRIPAVRRWRRRKDGFSRAVPPAIRADG